jgi:hypothetical protein
MLQRLAIALEQNLGTKQRRRTGGVGALSPVGEAAILAACAGVASVRRNRRRRVQEGLGVGPHSQRISPLHLAGNP